MIKYIASFFIICFATISHAQTLSAYEHAGDKAFKEKDYLTALHYYGIVVAASSKKSIAYKYAETCRLTKNYTDADKYYGQCDPKHAHTFYFQWAQVKQLIGDYGEAIRLYKEYVKISDNEDFKNIAKKNIALSEKYSALPKQSRHTLEKLPNSINTAYSEFGTWLSGDTLFYSTLLPNSKSKLWLYDMRTKKKSPLAALNSTQSHAGNISFHPTEKKVFFTRCQETNISKFQCKIFTAEITPAGSFQNIRAIAAPINLEGYTTTQPSFGYLKKENKNALFFSSDRPNGHGGMDIWYALEKQEGGFEEPKNLHILNSVLDEITPFFNPTEEILYFSSDGLGSMGGMDILKYDFRSSPTPLEYPINTNADDIYFSQTSPKNYLLNSNRQELDKIVPATCCFDVFKMVIHEKTIDSIPIVRKDTLPIVMSQIPPLNTKTQYTEPPLIKNPTTNNTPPSAINSPQYEQNFWQVELYFHNDEPDSNSLAMNTKKTYSEHFLYYETLVSLYKKMSMDNISPIDTFFSEMRKDFKKWSSIKQELQKELSTGSIIELSIEGYTSPRAPTDYNFRLANRRIKSIVNELNHLNSSKLIIKENPYGEITCPKNINDKYNEPQASIYGVAASRERKVKITAKKVPFR